MNRRVIAAATGALLLSSLSFLPDRQQDIATQLVGKNARQRAEIRAEAVLNHKKTGLYTLDGLTVEIVSMEKIDGGVRVFAKAWSNGKQLGFGDGTVEIERFNIYNPPTLVDDPQGDIVREIEDTGTNRIVERRLRQDPLQAIRESLAHTISLVAKDGGHVVPGKVGNTTSTFYPDANPESTSVDGFIENYADPGTCSSMTGAADGTSANDSSTSINGMQYSTGGADCNLQRGVTLFDTSSIPDGDTISSAIASLTGLFKGNTNSYSARMVTATPASNTALVAADFDQFGTTAIANEITLASFSTSGYNDFTLTDLTQVSKTGVSKFGWRLTGDISSATPTGQNYAQSASADTSGTSSDPKLVVVHTTPAPANNSSLFILWLRSFTPRAYAFPL